jgi:hypothetical protein
MIRQDPKSPSPPFIFVVYYEHLVAVLSNPSGELRVDFEGEGVSSEGLAIELGPGECDIR